MAKRKAMPPGLRVLKPQTNVADELGRGTFYLWMYWLFFCFFV